MTMVVVAVRGRTEVVTKLSMVVVIFNSFLLLNPMFTWSPRMER